MYLDAAIIVKLLVAEPDSPLFVEATAREPVETSELSLLEVAAAIHTKERTRLINAKVRAKALDLFERKLAGDEITVLSITSPTYLRARRFLEACHPQVALRSLDALHLAACDQHDAFPLCTTDARMRSAAERLGIPVFPESLS